MSVATPQAPTLATSCCGTAAQQRADDAAFIRQSDAQFDAQIREDAKYNRDNGDEPNPKTRRTAMACKAFPRRKPAQAADAPTTPIAGGQRRKVQGADDVREWDLSAAQGASAARTPVDGSSQGGDSIIFDNAQQASGAAATGSSPGGGSTATSSSFPEGRRANDRERAGPYTPVQQQKILLRID